MQKSNGFLLKDKIIIKKSKDIGRFFNKSHFGKLIKNELNINYIEGIFLLEEEKIKIIENGKEIDFKYLLKKAISKIPNFVIKWIYPLRKFEIPFFVNF